MGIIGLLLNQFVGTGKSGKAAELLAEIEEARVSALRGEETMAKAVVSKAMSAVPRNADVLGAVAGVLFVLKDFDGAEQCLCLALGVAPDNPLLHERLAQVLIVGGRLDEGEFEYRQAVAASGGSESAVRGLTEVLLRKNVNDEAMQLAQSLVDSGNSLPSDYLMLGLAAFRRKDFALASQSFSRALDLGVRSVQLFHGLATSRLCLRQLAEAEAIVKIGLGLFPESEDLNFALGLIHLSAGRLQEGFAKYQLRQNLLRSKLIGKHQSDWEAKVQQWFARIPECRPGEVIGKRILVLCEQGYGDILMMMRFLPRLVEAGAVAVTFVCPAPLYRFNACFDGITFIKESLDLNFSEAEFDGRCRIMSLPFLLQIASECQLWSQPYFFSGDGVSVDWQGRTSDSARDCLKVGFVWSGSPSLSHNELRNLPLQIAVPLFHIPGVRFFSLQKGEGASDGVAAFGENLVDFMDDCNDFPDTAGLIMSLDLVISVDTAVAHLAGALGKPVWLLNRYESDWRWQFGRDDSPWYPSMRVFNQTESRRWEPVIEKVVDGLRGLAQQHKEAPL